MRPFLMLAITASIVLLGGCADSTIIQDVCSHQISVTAAAELALKNAYLIQDPAARNAAIAAANATLALVAGCPGYAGPIPTLPAS